MKFRFNKAFASFFVVFVILFGANMAFGIATLDATFNAVASKPVGESLPMSQIVQPDGKIIIWGAQAAANGSAAGQIARLNVDGSLDSSFNYCGCHANTYSLNLLLQPDGKILISGTNSSTHATVVRLNSDGSVDNSFNVPTVITQSIDSIATLWAVQTDGKILVVKETSLSGGYRVKTLYRLNSDGGIDPTFANPDAGSGRSSQGYFQDVAISPDGKIYVATTSSSFSTTSGYLFRLKADGTGDSTWEAPTFSNIQNGTYWVQSLAIQSDGNILASGRFDRVNGADKTNIVRLFPAGNVDLTFNPPAGYSISAVKLFQNGKILVSANSIYGTPYKLNRLNADGSLDNTYLFDGTITSVLNRPLLDPFSRSVFFGQSNTGLRRYYRLNVNGDIDSSFNPLVTDFASVYAVATHLDGKIIVSGNFTQMNSQLRAAFARVNADGTTDATFDPGTGFNSPPTTLIVQSDGKILALGSFTNYNGTPRPGFARINSDGTLDAGFAPDVTQVNGITLQTDGKIILAGGFSTVNGTPKARVARLNSDGTLDASFGLSISSGQVYSVIPQSDGKFIAGGAFSGVDGFNRSNLVRFNANGTLDQTFNAGSIGSVNSIIIQLDGKYIAVFGAGQPTSIGRRNLDGTADASFVPPTFSFGDSLTTPRINSVLLQLDGSIVVGGNYNNVGNIVRNNLVRLSSSGALDQLFFQTGANAQIRSMAAQADGKIIVGGDFSRVESTLKAGIARIVPGAFSRLSPFDYDGDGKADISVFRASENKWYILRSSDGAVSQPIFAVTGDVASPADFDGDGKTDVAIFRPSNGDWWSLSSINNQQLNAHWGQAGDIALPSDFDGDGRADYVVFRPSTNQWLRASSANGAQSNKTFGLAGDKPVIGDFDGDGKSDVAIYRPSDGNWWWQSSVDNVQRATRWGIASDIPAPADFDGDGKTDFAVFRPSTGVWYIYNSATSTSTIGPFGLSGDKPVPADFDGDGKADIAVYRPSDGIWYLLRSTSGFTGFRFGIATDIPTQNAFLQ